MADTGAAAVEIRAVRKTFDRNVAVEALDLTIPLGSTYGLLGPNGSGKTTTIRMVLRILEPDEGEIRVFGRTPGPDTLDRIGYLPEERGLYRRMRVRPMLLFLAELKGVPSARAGPRIERWLDRVGLADRAQARIHELSKGMQQKLQFLAAIVHDPELVILDEPFSGLDPINQEALREIVSELRRDGRTILFSTHMIEHAERLCDHVCILARGRKVVDGEVARVKREHRGTFVALTVDGGDPSAAASILRRSPHVVGIAEEGRDLELALAATADPQAVLADLVAAGVRLRRWQVVEPSLRQIFLERAGATGIAPESRP
jgi:ABC-2 type transport system ATP-binding protein